MILKTESKLLNHFIKIKKILSFFLFTPKYFSFLNYFKKINNHEIRPYFGINIFKTGGPYLRTKKISIYFGNYWFFPNIIYAQSYWTSQELNDAINYSDKFKIPIVFNQNGWFYKGWYKKNWKIQNLNIVDAHKKSSVVIYQSNFCKSASKKLNNYTKKKSLIIHNSLYECKNKPKKNLKLNYFLLSGVFDENSKHIIEPAIVAFKYFSKKIDFKKINLKLIIMGFFTNGAKKKNWYKKITNDIGYLDKLGILEFRGKYDQRYLGNTFSDINFALHLKYKDPCPNAVVERIKHKIIHIYSNSGGTPELIGNAGLPVNVLDSWKKQVSVNPKILVKKILYAIKTKNKLLKKVEIVSKKYRYKDYINRHKKIFFNAINKN